MPTHLLSPGQRHLVGRFSYGLTPALADQVRAHGGARTWFEWQLHPADIADPVGDHLDGWFTSLTRTPSDLWARNIAGVEHGSDVMSDFERWCLLRRIYSQRQVLEVMTEFWQNLVHVPANGDPAFTHRTSYDATIRAHALGRYDQLLQAAITHPAMLIYLDAVSSTASHPNENLGRELLELHTVGRGDYSEDEVKASARILTGFTVDQAWVPSYVTADHATGPVRVMGFSDPNGDGDGRPVVARYLTYLAHHPLTAQRIAQRLAVKFVRDDPPAGLVQRLAAAYLAHDTAIVPVLRVLLDSPEFKAAAGLKVRDPGEDVVATYRSLDVTVHRPRTWPPAESSAVTNVLWQSSSLGTMPYCSVRPDGQPIDSGSWSSPSRLVGSFGLHYSMSGGWWPERDVSFHPARHWLPAPRIRFDRLVEHLAGRLLHRPASRRLLTACSQAVRVPAHTVITPHHDLVVHDFPRLLTTLLDSPDFLTR